jgi:heptosyltransferase-1
MPAITDAARRHPQARIAWVVEEDYAALARLHPAVGEVIAVATRRWRRQLHRPGTWREVAAFAGLLRRRRFDRIIDTQGLVRTALIARLARGVRHGFDAASVRERPAAWFYDIGHGVDRRLHAIERNRRLTGQALGYTPEGEPDAGLRPPVQESTGRRQAILLHGSAQVAKEWPQAHWISIAKTLEAAGREISLPWGNARERARSETIARALGRAHIPDRESLDLVAGRLAACSIVVGLDTGLLHLAAALATPLVAIFVNSDPELTGPRGRGPMQVVGSRGFPPTPEAVIAAINKVLADQPA